MEKQKTTKEKTSRFTCFIYISTWKTAFQKVSDRVRAMHISAIPVWEMLNISKEDFKKTCLKPFVIDAKGNEISIDVDNENQEMKKT